MSIMNAVLELLEKKAQHTPPSEMEKHAAMSELLCAGMVFDEAVSLVKEAAEKGPYGYRDAYSTSVRASNRSLAEGAAGAAGVGAAGYGVGRVVGAARTSSASKVIEHGSRSGKLGQIASKLKSKGARKAGAVGAVIGGVSGFLAGSAHGNLKSLSNSLNDAHAKGKASQ